MTRVFDTPIHTTDQSIDRVLAVNLPVLLLFSDGPADEGIKNKLSQIAQANAGKLLVVQMQARDNPQSAARFGFGRYPAVAVLRDGQIFASAEQISAAELDSYAAYAMGSGPEPERQKPVHSAAAAPSSNGPTRGGSKPIAVSEATFEQEVLKSDLPVLVDFWAEWCGPCHRIAPVVEKLARELDGRLKVAKVDVDRNPGFTTRYGIRGIPTMMIFKAGQIVDQWTGAAPEQMILSKVSKWL